MAEEPSATPIDSSKSKKKIDKGHSKEFAESELARFAEAMNLDFDVEGMNENDRVDFSDLKNTAIRALRAGSLTFSDEGLPRYMPESGEFDLVTFNEPTVADMMEMDKKKENADVAKSVAVLASVTGTPSVTISKMAIPDFKVLQAVIQLFMG